MAAPASALAAPPNDDFANAEVLGTAPLTVTGSNVGATFQAPNEPPPALGSGAVSIWYRWTAPANAEYKVSLRGTNFDTLLDVYTGSTLTGLSRVAAGDDQNDGSLWSDATFTATAGTTYRIAINGYSADEVGDVQLSLFATNPPANDDFANAAALDPSGDGVHQQLELASLESGEPEHAGIHGGHSVWYRLNAPGGGFYSLSTCGSAFDTLLAVYTGTAVGALTPVVSSDDAAGCSAGGSKLELTAAAGTDYWIAVDGKNGALGQADLDLSLLSPPDNDDLAAAEPLSGTDDSFTGTNASATSESGEPLHAGVAGGRSVWFSWTAPDTGSYRIDTCGSALDTLLAVYTGSAYGALTGVAGNDDAGTGCSSSTRSAVTIAATQGTAYRIAVDGKAGAEGNVVLELHSTAPPANDAFASAESLTGTSDSASGDNWFATKEGGEPSHAGNAGGHSVWFTWTAPDNRNYTLGTCDGTLDTLLAVYTGAAVGTLTPVAGNDDGCGVRSQLSFDAVAGTAYTIAVDGKNGGQGEVALNLVRNPDLTAPNTTIQSGASGPIGVDDVSYDFTASESPATFECRLDGPGAAVGTYASCNAPKAYDDLDDGAYTFRVRASDESLNVDSTPDTRSFTVDTNAPETSISGGPSGLTAGNDPTFTLTSNEPSPSFQCRLDGPGAATGTYASCPAALAFTDLADGQYTLSVIATDAVGNADPSAATREFTVDTTAPGTTIGTGPSGTVPSGNVQFTFSGSGSPTGFECRLNGPGSATGTFASCSSPKAYSNLADGTYSFSVRAIDAAGNVDASPATRSFTVKRPDRTPPQTTITTKPLATVKTTKAAATVTFAFTSNEAGSRFQCSRDGGAYVACVSPLSCSAKVGSRTFAVRAIDRAGNVDPTPATYSFKVVKKR